MSIYYSDDKVTLHHGDCLEVLATLPDASVDAVVTDPPYNLTSGKRGGSGAASVNLNTPHGRSRIGTGNGPGGFMGQAWDNYDGFSGGFQGWCQAWATECLRVLKPGGHLLAFGGTRTWHRLAVAVEDAGFEIRDNLAWLYGSGFPKSLNLVDEGGERTGQGTALKPAFEPIVMARKPLTGTVAANVLEHGTGALNIDACRVAHDEPEGRPSTGMHGRRAGIMGETVERHRETTSANTSGRWPANVVLDESQAEALDEQSGTLTSGSRKAGTHGLMGYMGADAAPMPEVVGDTGGASRFFYVAKAPKSERPVVDGVAHPTVKPISLMSWLVRLVTPPGGTVLEPFAGSGTTVEAAMREGFNVVAVEREADYLPLIMAASAARTPARKPRTRTARRHCSTRRRHEQPLRNRRRTWCRPARVPLGTWHNHLHRAAGSSPSHRAQLSDVQAPHPVCGDVRRRLVRPHFLLRELPRRMDRWRADGTPVLPLLEARPC